MTYQPPQPPPGSPPPPPPGQWGPPPSSGGSGFDPKSVNNLDWAIAGVAVLAVIFSYIHYYTFGPYSGGTGFVGFLAWLLGVIGAVCALAQYFMPNFKLPVPIRLVGVAAFVLALILSLLKMVARPGAYGIHVSIGIGLIIATILYAVGAALSFMRFTQTGGNLQQSINDIKGNRGIGNTPPPPPPGYQQQPPAQQQYGTPPPPPPPPPGYGQPPQQ